MGMLAMVSNVLMELNFKRKPLKYLLALEKKTIWYHMIDMWWKLLRPLSMFRISTEEIEVDSKNRSIEMKRLKKFHTFIFI